MGKSKSGLCSETMRIGHRIIMTGIATTTNISNYIINFENAFGLKNIPAELGDVYIRVYLDQLPDTKEKM